MLPYDVARCGGNPSRLECDDCQRRSPGRPERQTYIGFWELDGPCPYRIKNEMDLLKMQNPSQRPRDTTR